MLAEEVRKLIGYRTHANMTLLEQIKYIDDLEKQGIIERPTPQTAYKYPVDIFSHQK